MTTIHRTYQLRGYTTSAGYDRLDAVLRQCAVLYNAALEEWRTAYKQARVSRTYYDQTKELTLIRRDDPDMWGALSMQIGRGVLKRLDRARKAFFRRVKSGDTPGYPRFKSGRRWSTVELAEVSAGMVKESGRHYLVKVKGLPVIRLRRKRALPDAKCLKGLSITRRGRRLFVNLTYELAGVDIPAAVPDTAEIPNASLGSAPRNGESTLLTSPPKRSIWSAPRNGESTLARRGVAGIGVSAPRNGESTISAAIPRVVAPRNGESPAIGLDLGIIDRIALSNGESIPRRTKSNDKKKAQKRLSRCKGNKKGEKKSRQWRERKAVLANIQHREQIANRNECHRITTALVRRFSLIAAEDLRITNMSRSARGTVESPGTNVAQKAGLNRAIAEQTWGVILNQLEYKAEWAGQQLVLVNPQYTSQTCSECGMVNREARQGKTYDCGECGNRMDADVNAALNILNRAMAGGNVPAAALDAAEIQRK